MAAAGTALLGALLLVVAEFTTLFTVRTAASAGPVDSVGTGSHHGYAMIPIALLVSWLAVSFVRRRDRLAMPAVALLGLVALLIALLGDLPDAEASSQLLRVAGGYALGDSSPAAGMYLETLGATLLLVAGVGSLLAFEPLGPPALSKSPARPAL